MKAWEQNIRKVEPYVPGEQPKQAGIIKLNPNENPYPPAPEVQRILNQMDAGIFRKYPDPAASSLVNCLAQYYGLRSDQVFVGVGSDDVLSVAFLTFFNSEKPIFFPDITYSFYDVWASVYRIPFEKKPLQSDFHLNPRDYYAENGGVIFPNPNAPTGLYEPLAVIEDILQHNQDVVVIVDEAYVDYAPESARKLLDQYENLLIVQTFSKSRSMAGMRIGYAMGHPDLIRAMNDVKYSINSYTMNAPSLLAGVAAVEDDAYFRENVRKVIATRERAKVELKALGFTFPDSSSNFLFARHSSADAGWLFEELKKKGIFVRHFGGAQVKDYLRISMGTEKEMEQLYRVLREILQGAD